MQNQIRQLRALYMLGKAVQPYSYLQKLEIPCKLWQVMPGYGDQRSLRRKDRTIRGGQWWLLNCSWSGLKEKKDQLKNFGKQVICVPAIFK